MTNLFSPKTKNEQADSLAQFLPEGKAFEAKNIDDSNLRKILMGLACELMRVDQMMGLISEEHNIEETTLFIDEWESAVGIPDQCIPIGETLEQRRANVLLKFANMNAQVEGDFIRIASVLGFDDIEITPLQDLAFPAYNVPFRPTRSPESRFTMIVRGSNVSTGFPAYNVPFTPVGGLQSILQCVFDQISPSNVRIIYENKDDVAGSESDGFLKMSEVVSGNVIDLDVRRSESYNGTSTIIQNIEGDSTYDVDISGLEFLGEVGSSDAKTEISTSGAWLFQDIAAHLPFINSLHKNDTEDYYFGFKFEIGSSLSSQSPLDAASSNGLELLIASDGRTKSKRRTTSGNEELTTSTNPSITPNTSYELFYTREASTGNFKVYINNTTPITSSIPYNITELADADSGTPQLFNWSSASGDYGIAVVAGRHFLSDQEVQDIKQQWSKR